MDAQEEALGDAFKILRPIRGKRKADLTGLRRWNHITRMVPSEMDGETRLYIDFYGAQFRTRGGYDNPIEDYIEFLAIKAKLNGEEISTYKSPRELGIKVQDAVIELEVCVRMCCFSFLFAFVSTVSFFVSDLLNLCLCYLTCAFEPL